MTMDFLGVFIETTHFQAYLDLLNQNLVVKPRSLQFLKAAQVICMYTNLHLRLHLDEKLWT